MGKKFKMRVILYENDTLGMVSNCNGANGAEVIAVLHEIVNAIAEKLYPNEAEKDRFIHDFIITILQI